MSLTFTEENEGMTVKRRGRPRKNANFQGKKLFVEQSSSDEEDSIGASDHEAQDEEDEDEDEDDEAPLIQSIKSASKLRTLKVKRDGVGQKKLGNSVQTTDNMAASGT